MNAMDRVGAFSGAAYFVLANIGNTLGQDASVPENATGREILDSYGRLAGDVSRQIGIGVEMLGLAAWVVFVAYVYSRTRAAGWLGRRRAGRRDDLDRGEVRILRAPDHPLPPPRRHESGDSAHAHHPQPGVVHDRHTASGIFVACGAAAAMITHSLGRVLGWAGVVVGAVNVFAAVIVGPRIEGVSRRRSCWPPSGFSW